MISRRLTANVSSCSDWQEQQEGIKGENYIKNIYFKKTQSIERTVVFFLYSWGERVNPVQRCVSENAVVVEGETFFSRPTEGDTIHSSRRTWKFHLHSMRFHVTSAA